MPQNLLSVGFNVSELQAQKAEVLSIVQDLYAQLSKYDNTKISPINLTGLSQLTQATQQQAAQVSNLNKSISELGLSIQAYNNLATQSAKLSAQIAVSETEEAKAVAASKVALSEKNKALQEEARLNNESYQNKLKSIQAEKDRTSMFKEADAEAERIVNNQVKAQKRLEQAENDTQKARIRNAREADALQKQQDKQRAAEGKAILAQNDLYQQLLAKRKDLETRFANSVISGQPKSVQQGLANQLREVNTVITTTDKALEKAGSGGATAFARALTSGLSSLRTIAYILPGIGIAGIFNLAYEAVSELFSGVDKLNKTFQDTIENQEKLNSLLLEEINILKQLDEAERRRDESRRNSIQRGQALENFANLAGRSPEDKAAVQALGSDRDFLTTQSTVLRQFGDFQGLQKRIDEQIKAESDLEKSLEKLVNVRKNFDKQTELAKQQGNTNPLKGVVKPDKDIAAVDALISLRKKQIEDLQSNLKDNQTLLDNYIQGEKEFGEKRIEEEKLLYDIERKKVLDLAKQQEDANINANKRILQNQLSTESQRIDALNNIRNAQVRKQSAENQFVQTDRDLSPKQKLVAQDEFNKFFVESQQQLNKDVTDVQLDFWKKRTDIITDYTRKEIQIQEDANKQIYQDDVKTFEERLKTLSKFIDERKLEIELQYQHDLDVAKRTTPADILPDRIHQLNIERTKSLADINSQAFSDVYNVTKTWFSRQLQLTVDSYDKTNDATTLAHTKELIELNKSFDAKELSYSKYFKKKDKLEHEFLLKGDVETIDRDKKFLEQLQVLSHTVDLQIQSAQEEFINATTEESAKSAGKKLQGLVESRTSVTKQITAQQQKVSDDELKYQQDYLKRIQDAHNTLRLNLVRLYENLFNQIKQIVDANYQYQILKVQELLQVREQGLESEQAALDRSSISSKEKNAYDIQLLAQKTKAEEEAAQKQKRLRHDQAVFDRDIDIAKIILDTELAVAGALTHAKELGALAIPLAISFGALGATALATAVATKIPAYAEGGIHKKSGFALFGEAGSEYVKEPGKSGYIAEKPTVKHLPAGTELIPLYKVPTLPEKQDNSWQQTLYLGKAIAKSKKEIKNIFKPNIKVDLGSELYKNRILHG